MTESKQQIELRELLCSVPEIEEQIWIWYINKQELFNNDKFVFDKYPKPQERHLRLFCEKKNIQMSILENGNIFHDKSAYSIITDNTKDLFDQPSETLQSIIDFLKLNT